MLDYPHFFRLRQTFDRPLVDDIPATVERELARLELHRKIRPGQTVAVPAGSRGIAHIALILRQIVAHLRALGAEPFLIPAMGSHGGGTVPGQLELLATNGISESSCGCPIRATMETVVVCHTAEGFPVHFDKYAYAADHVFVCNRIKPHTEFSGDIQSGLMKMLLIGFGKHEGAKIYHRACHDYSFSQIVRSVAGRVLEQCKVVGGLAILENGYDETAQFTAVRPAEFEPREKELLQLATRWLPRLPFDRADLLIVDEIGKNISGTGLDTNVVGRKIVDDMAPQDHSPKIRRIAIRSLTEATHGNASGIGIAEFCRSQVLRDMDDHKTRTNALTSGNIVCILRPLDYETDREILDAALPTIGLADPPDAKILWIKNTLELSEVECSAAYLQAASNRSDLQILTPLRPLPLDPQGNLPKFAPFANH